MSHPIKLTFLTPSLGCGGAEWWIHSLVNYLNPRDFTTESVVVVHPQLGDDSVICDGISSITRLGYGDSYAKEATKAADIVISWGLKNTLDLVPPEKPLVMVSHSDGDCLPVDGCEEASGLVAVSEAAIFAFPEAVRSEVVVLLNGVDGNRLKQTALCNDQLGLLGISDAETKVVLMVGRISPEKNCSALPATIAALPKNWIGIHVGKGLGSGPEEEMIRLKELSQEMAPGRVFWLDNSYQLANFYEVADILFQPSHMEGCSYTVLEAFYMGVPVFTTPVGLFHRHSFKELAYLIDPDSTGETIAERILSHGEEFPSCAARVAMARKLVEVDLSMSAFITRWSNYLRNIIN